MFQYAFGLALSKRLNDKIAFSLRGMTNETHNVYSLNYFNIKNIKIDENYKFTYIQKIFYRIIKKFLHNAYIKKGNSYRFKIEKNYQKLFNKFGIYICQDGYVNTFNTSQKSKIVEGYFQSSKYFDEVKSQLKKDFVVSVPVMKENAKLLKKIENTNSVCVHIRRGDYTKVTNHLVCNIDYYKKGMRIINKECKDAEFFIFSDDIEWVKDNIKFDYKVNYVTGNNPNYEELRLMYSCKNFIISNSSFSWWAQYLSNNKNKVVVSPSRWFNDSTQQADQFQDDWIKIIV